MDATGVVCIVKTELERSWECDRNLRQNLNKEVSPSKVLVPMKKVGIRTNKIRSGKNVTSEIKSRVSLWLWGDHIVTRDNSAAAWATRGTKRRGHIDMRDALSRRNFAAVTSAGISGHFAHPMGKTDRTEGGDDKKKRMKSWKKAAKRTWLLSRHTSAPDVRERRSLSRRSSALSTGSLWMEKTSEEEETPAVEAPRAKKRKAGGPPELPT